MYFLLFFIGAAVATLVSFLMARRYVSKLERNFHFKINEQKNEINKQIKLLTDRAATIEAVTGNMREGLILIDKSGRVLAANRSALDVFNEQTMVEKNILYVYREVEFQEKTKQCLNGERNELVLHKDEKIFNIYFSPVMNDGIVTGVVILFFDITAVFAAEKQRREFTANVSHELKTPLTTIRGFSELIEHGMAKEGDIKLFASKITAQVKRLVYLIEDIIKLSEIDEKPVGYEKESFNLRELAETVVTGLTEKADEKGVRIYLEGEEFSISANKRMIDELLFNLIDNGVSYNKENGSVNVSLSYFEGRCKIAVADTGIGIPLESSSRIFERFYTVDLSRSKKNGGTGLGLAIVKHIAECHGGTVKVESRIGEGTTFVCDISVC